MSTHIARSTSPCFTDHSGCSVNPKKRRKYSHVEHVQTTIELGYDLLLYIFDIATSNQKAKLRPLCHLFNAQQRKGDEFYIKYAPSIFPRYYKQVRKREVTGKTCQYHHSGKMWASQWAQLMDILQRTGGIKHVRSFSKLCSAQFPHGLSQDGLFDELDEAQHASVCDLMWHEICSIGIARYRYLIEQFEAWVGGDVKCKQYLALYHEQLVKAQIKGFRRMKMRHEIAQVLKSNVETQLARFKEQHAIIDRLIVTLTMEHSLTTTLNDFYKLTFTFTGGSRVPDDLLSSLYSTLNQVFFDSDNALTQRKYRKSPKTPFSYNGILTYDSRRMTMLGHELNVHYKIPFSNFMRNRLPASSLDQIQKPFNSFPHWKVEK